MKLLFLFGVTVAIANPCFAQNSQSPAAGIIASAIVTPGSHIAEPQDLPVIIAGTLEPHDPFPPATQLPQSDQSSGASSSVPAEVDADTAGHEVELFVGSGIGINGRSFGRPVMNAGARFGWVLTDRHSSRFYDGRFEFGFEFDPLFVVWQRGGAAYGFDFYAFILKWNFTPHGHIAPYFEFAGGGVITNKDIPPGVNTFNFTPTASAGIRILQGKYAWSIGFRWLHISDAGITYPNPGEDTVGFRIGFSRWLK